MNDAQKIYMFMTDFLEDVNYNNMKEMFNKSESYSKLIKINGSDYFIKNKDGIGYIEYMNKVVCILYTSYDYKTNLFLSKTSYYILNSIISLDRFDDENRDLIINKFYDNFGKSNIGYLKSINAIGINKNYLNKEKLNKVENIKKLYDKILNIYL